MGVFDDDWDDIVPDEDGREASIGETVRDTAMFFGKVLLCLLVGAIAIGSLAYAVVRELMIIEFLLGR